MPRRCLLPAVSTRSSRVRCTLSTSSHRTRSEPPDHRHQVLRSELPQVGVRPGLLLLPSISDTRQADHPAQGTFNETQVMGLRAHDSPVSPIEPEAEVIFSTKLREQSSGRLAIAIPCRPRFGREHTSQKPSGGTLEGGRRGLFRAQATCESRHGRRPRAAFLVPVARNSPAATQVPCSRAGDIMSGSLDTVVGAASAAAGAAQVPALRDRATGRSGSWR